MSEKSVLQLVPAMAVRADEWLVIFVVKVIFVAAERGMTRKNFSIVAYATAERFRRKLLPTRHLCERMIDYL